MKFYQQVYTSAPAGLWTSGQGYSTVACHEKIPLPVRRYTESLSYDVEACGGQPVFFFAHVENWVLFNRTCATRADHTGRSNYVAHTIAAPLETVTQWLSELEDANKPIVSPAALILYWDQTHCWRDEWKEGEEPKLFSEADQIDCPEPETVAVVYDHKNKGWYSDPTLGLAALDDDLNFKKLIWEGVDDPIELLIYFDQVSRAFDPALGVLTERKTIVHWFPYSAKECWKHSFATLLTKSQKPDDFLWYGVRNSLSTGAKSSRERLSIANPVVSPAHSERAAYIKDSKTALLNDAQTLYQTWKSAFYQELEHAREQVSQHQGAVENKLRNELETADQHLTELKRWTQLIESLLNQPDPRSGAERCVDSASRFSMSFSKPNDGFCAPDIPSEKGWTSAFKYLTDSGGYDPEASNLRNEFAMLMNSAERKKQFAKLSNDTREKMSEIAKKSSELNLLLKRMGSQESKRASLPLPKPDNFSGNRRTRKKELEGDDPINQSGEPRRLAWFDWTRLVCELLLLTGAVLLGYKLFEQKDSIKKGDTDNAKIRQVTRDQGDQISQLKGELEKKSLLIKDLSQSLQEANAALNKSPKKAKPKEDAPEPSATGAPPNDGKGKNTTK